MISFREKGNNRTTNLSATMKNAPARFCIRLGLGSVGLLLASCALPPQQAWRVIKKEGLIPYIAMEINHRQAAPSSRYIGSGSVAQTPVARPADQSKAVSAPVTPPPSPVLVNRSAASIFAASRMPPCASHRLPDYDVVLHASGVVSYATARSLR